MEPTIKLGTLESKVFSIILFHDGCNFNTILDKLADYFGVFVGVSCINITIKRLVEKKVIEIDMQYTEEATERLKRCPKIRRYFYINEEAGNPLSPLVKEYKEDINRIVESNNLMVMGAKKQFLRDYRDYKKSC